VRIKRPVPSKEQKNCGEAVTRFRPLALIARWMRQRSLVIEHPAEIAHVKPAFKEVKLNGGHRWPRQVSILIWRAHMINEALTNLRGYSFYRFR
jgi:hypothetical protein